LCRRSFSASGNDGSLYKYVWCVSHIYKNIGEQFNLESSVDMDWDLSAGE